VEKNQEKSSEKVANRIVLLKDGPAVLYKKKSVLIFGGCGGLGSVLVRTFKDAGFTVITVDFRVNTEANGTIQLSGSPTEMNEVTEELNILNIQFDAVICVAGGFRMGNLQPDQIVEDLTKMFTYNVKSAVSAAHISTKFLRPGGLLMLTGANAALRPTPQMIAYGVSKAATHHLVRSLAQEGSGLPENSSVIAILPIMLDTPQNRKDMPDASFDDWTPLETVASQLLTWTSTNERPPSGSMMLIQTKQKSTRFVPIKVADFEIPEFV